MHTQSLTPEILVPRLGNYLVENGIITGGDLQIALRNQESTSDGKTQQLIGQILVNLGIIDQTTLDQAITEQIIQLRNALQSANASLEQRVQDRTAELNSAYHKLSELDRLKSNFVANISHELRTPLTHLNGYLDLLSSGELGSLEDRQLQALNVLNKAYHRLSKLIDDLILFSSIDRDHLNLNFQFIDLKDIFNDLKRQFSPSHSEKQFNLLLNCSLDIPPVYIDRDRIIWVLTHLIDNAIKFSSQPVKISVDAKSEDNQVLVSIDDNGIGIPKEKLDEIFEPFHQLDGTSTRSFGGTGLGLSLAREIIEAHHSHIHVSSQVEIGSHFQFYLYTSSNPSND